MPPVEDYSVVSFDTHFRDVPNFHYADFNPLGYAAMLMELGVEPEKAGSTNNVYIRPDYKFAYTRWEKVKKFLGNPFDYTDAASCAENNNGGVDIVIVYGSGYGVNKLLRHETLHAVRKLQTPEQHGIVASLKKVIQAKRMAREEEEEADELMNDKHLTARYGKLIQISREQGSIPPA